MRLFVKTAQVGCETTPAPVKREKNSSTEAFNGVCTNKISLFDQSSLYLGRFQWAYQSEAFSLSKKLLAGRENLKIRNAICGIRGKTCFHFCDTKLKQRFQSEIGLNLATGRGKTNLPSFHGLVSYLHLKETKIHFKELQLVK